MTSDGRLRGSALGLTSALLFGLGAPASKLLLPQAPPLLLAALLYLGAGAAFLAVRRGRAEAPLRRADAPVLAASVISGALLAPVLLLWGLLRVSGLTGSLLLNLEAPFTMALAVLAFGEHLALRELAAAALVAGGGMLLGAGGEVGFSGGGCLLGARVDLTPPAAGQVAIALDCLCWALDNTLSALLAMKDPVQV